MVRCLQEAAVVGSIWRWPKNPDEKEHILEDIHQEIETPSTCGSKTSSLRSSNLLAHVPEPDYLYKQTFGKICSTYYSCLLWFMIY